MRNCTRDEGGPFGFGDRQRAAENTRWLAEFSFPNRVGVTSCCPVARR
jgi:hypothetical protein